MRRLCYAVDVTGEYHSDIAEDRAFFKLLRRAGGRLESWLDVERDQLPLGLSVAVGLGIIAWQYAGTNALVDWLCLCGALILLGFTVGSEHRAGAASKWAGMALATGFIVIAAKSTWVAAAPLPGIFVGEFHGRITQVEMLSAREAVRLTLETDGHGNLPLKVRVNLRPEQYLSAFREGAVIKVRARLMPPAQPALPGGYDFARRAWFQQLGATGTALGQVELVNPAPESDFWTGRRYQLTRHVLDAMPEQYGTIGAALITGDQGHILEDDAQAMRDSGLAHLLSVSGLHVTAVVTFVFLIVSRSLSLWSWLALRVPVPIIAAAVSAIGAVTYTLLAGAEVPTMRSCIAALLILVALVMGRDPLSLRLVAFGALLVMIFWPESLAGPSFQLSFAAVTTIIVLHQSSWMQRFAQRRDEPILRKIGRNALILVLTGFAIEVILAPIALYHFHRTGLYGALANVVAIPLTTFFIMPMEALALFFDIVGIGQPFWWLAGVGIGWLLDMAHYISSTPGSVSTLPSMPDWAFAAMIGGALLIGLLRTKARWIGSFPFIAGMTAMLLAPRPDLLVTGDGRHVALTGQDGEVALLRAGAGDFTRDMMREHAGLDQEPVAIEDMPGTTCSPDICIFAVERGGRQWRILATRTRYFIDWREMTAACASVDIAISDRILPKGCNPRWIKADRKMLWQTGGLSFYLPSGRVETVNERIRHTPWYQAAETARLAAAERRKRAVEAK